MTQILPKTINSAVTNLVNANLLMHQELVDKENMIQQLAKAARDRLAVIEQLTNR